MSVSFEPQTPLTIDQRIEKFREQGIIAHVETGFTHQDIIASYYSDGSNNADFSRLYGKVSELINQIIEDTEFLEHLTSEDAENLLRLMHQLRNGIKMTLEGAIDEISRFVTTPEELATYVGVIPTSDLDELAQTVMQATEMVQLFSQADTQEGEILHTKLNQRLITKLKRIRERLTTIEDLARLLQQMVRENNT
jgi:hypothetical protein